jgi:uncharacterized protein (TIGR00375 family)
MELPSLTQWAKKKGINLLGTGDFTHPQWFAHLEEHLVPQDNGLYRYEGVWFLPTAEISSIWSQDGGVRKVHLVLLAPSLRTVAKVNAALGRIGNLAADGRPIFGLSAKRLVEIIWNVEPTVEVIPAHVWTPWFSVFGSRSGFDSLEACFGEHVERIFAIETGLSSDPAMNWRVSALDDLALISCSDAHSPSKLGREVTLFDLPEPSYEGLITALKTRDPKRFLGTVEFYPEEGKYHYDGHRACGVVLSPQDSLERDNLCPVCGKPLTLGVLHRVRDLADRAEGSGPTDRAPYRSLVPLEEIIAQSTGVQPGTKTVESEYERLIAHFGNEFRILTELPEETLARRTPARILDGIRKVRSGNLHIEPGYDGVYGKISISFDEESATEQLSLL